MIRGLSFATIMIYNLLAVICLLFLLKKYRWDEIAKYIIIMFFAGVAADSGKTVQNLYKIGLLLWSIRVFILYADTSEIYIKYRRVFVTIVLFIMYVLLTGFFIHHDGIFLMFSQLSKYIIPVLTIPILFEIIKDRENLDHYNELFKYILFAQVFLCVIKLALIGNWYEGLVGSITGVAGGAVGTSLPLVGLCWLFTLSEKFKFNRTNILFMIGLLFIGFMAGKRAVWLLFPILFTILYLYVDKQKIEYKLLSIVLISPIIFYLGLRLTPSLNPEGKVWGSFDPEFTINYIVEYNDMGNSDIEYQEEVAMGRMGANSLMLRLLVESEYLKDWQIWGLGSKRILAADYEKYRDSEYYMGISNRGAVTGIVKLFLAYGCIGVILFLLFLFSIFSMIENIRVKIVMSTMLLFDFIFYNASMCSMIPVFVFYLFTAFSLSKKIDEGLYNELE